MKPSVARLAWLGLALVAAGCAGAQGAECQTDAQCIEPLICFANVCEAVGEPAGDVRLEVVPPVGSGLPGAFFSIEEQPLRLELCASSIEGEAVGPATLDARGVLAGGTGARAQVRRSVDGAFSLPLPAGSWELTLLFDQPALSPPVHRMVELARCAAESVGTIGPSDEVLHARFSIRIDPVRDPRPRCGVRARIHDVGTGRALSRELAIESRPGQPCAEPAEGWTLPFLAPEGDQGLELRLEPLDGSRPTLPSLAFPFEVQDGQGIDLGALGVGDATLERVRVFVTDPDGDAVEDARVQTIGTLPDGVSRFEPPLARPLGAGLYETWLLPGTYQVRIEPPAGVPAAIARCVEPAEGGSCEPNLVVEQGLPSVWQARLPLPLRIGGRILDEEREPVPGARVVALPLGDHRSFAAISGPGGRYELLVDPGAYQLLAQPQLPEAAWAREEPPGPIVVDTNIHLQLPEAARVLGTAVTDDGTPLARALIRAWLLEPGRDPLLLGETLADPRGRFGLALPAR